MLQFRWLYFTKKLSFIFILGISIEIILFYGVKPMARFLNDLLGAIKDNLLYIGYFFAGVFLVGAFLYAVTFVISFISGEFFN